MQIKCTFWLPMLALLAGGCGTVQPINMKESEMHYRAARGFEARGDYVSAREQDWKALVAARTGNASPALLSMLTYEFGRTTGYACHLSESEKFLLESVQLEESLPNRNSRHIGIRHFELARLRYDQRRYADAAASYSLGLREVEANGSIKQDPITFADIYEEQADALEKSGDGKRAAEQRKKAQALRDAHPDAKALFKPVRYKCDKPI